MFSVNDYNAFINAVCSAQFFIKFMLDYGKISTISTTTISIHKYLQ